MKLKNLRKDIISVLNKEALIDIHHSFSSKKMNIFSRNLHPNWYLNNIVYSILLFFLLFFKKIITYKRHKFKDQEIPVLLIAYTNNQRQAIYSIKKIRNDAKIFGDNQFSDFIFPMYKSYFFSIPYFNCIFRFYKNVDNYVRISLHYAFHEYWLTFGHFNMLIKFLKKYKTKLVVVSNDHYLRTRIVPYVCSYLGIKSVYIQHASISLLLPPLIYDFALLEGRDALNKYFKIGKIKSDVFLVGNLKAPQLDDICKKLKVINLGLCFGIVDDISKVEELIINVLNVFDATQVFLRPHPLEKRHFFIKEMAIKYNINISDSRVEKVTDFLKNIQCVIASESNIHLESIMQNIYSIYYQLSDKEKISYDFYGFLSSKLIKDYSDSNKLIDKLIKLKDKKPNVRKKARYYNATIGTKYEDKSYFLYNEVISFIKNHDINTLSDIFKVEKIHGVNVYTIK